MSETTYLASPTASGYTEERRATYNDDGTMKSVNITVKWDDGTEHDAYLELTGPPGFGVYQSGGLVYPDGSTTSIEMTPDGTLDISHLAKWRSPDDEQDTRVFVTDWKYDRDGSGRYWSATTFTNQSSHGQDEEWHSFDREGALSSEVRQKITEFNDRTGGVIVTEITTTLDGTRTTHMVIKDREDNVISDTTYVTQVDPLVESPPRTSTSRGRGEPRTATQTTGTAGGGAGGFIAEGRAIKTEPLCEHWVDYYVAYETAEPRYIGSRYHGVGPCP